MTIYLVRHTEYSNPDNIFPFHLPVELSPEGIAHAERIANWFKDQTQMSLPIFTSPIRRTVQTAEIIGKVINSTISLDNRLVESLCPNLQGKKQPGIEGSDEAGKMQCADPSRETSESLQKRTAECFKEKVKEGKDCILVSHGDPLTSLYYYLLNKPLVYCFFDDDNFETTIKRGEIVKVTISDSYKTERFTV